LKTAPSPPEFPPRFDRLQGAPRGLLLYYILHKVSQGPTHGYEISQDIEQKTNGAWRPAAGSIYPMLKKLDGLGYIRAKSGTSKRLSETEQRVYEITPLGLDYLKEGRAMFANAGDKFSSVRRLFLELIDPQNASKFFVEGSRMHFEGSREIVESKMSSLPEDEVESILKEYELGLERQLSWTRGKIAQFERVAPKLQGKRKSNSVRGE
jgi:DNA-binding PadR family transcriptional regulator